MLHESNNSKIALIEINNSMEFQREITNENVKQKHSKQIYGEEHRGRWWG